MPLGDAAAAVLSQRDQVDKAHSKFFERRLARNHDDRRGLTEIEGHPRHHAREERLVRNGDLDLDGELPGLEVRRRTNSQDLAGDQYKSWIPASPRWSITG